MRSAFTTFALLVLFSTLAIAQQPATAAAPSPPKDPAAVTDPNAATRAQVLELLEAMQIKKAMRDMFETTLPAMMHNMNVQQMQGMSMSMNEKQKTMFVDGMSQIEAGMLQDFNLDDFVDLYVPIYQRHFSNSDIAPVITFYRSPAGLKLLSEQGPIMQEGTNVVGQYMNQKMNAIQTKMMPKIALLMTQVEAAADKKPVSKTAKPAATKTTAATKSTAVTTKKPSTATKSSSSSTTTTKPATASSTTTQTKPPDKQQ